MGSSVSKTSRVFPKTTAAKPPPLWASAQSVDARKPEPNRHPVARVSEHRDDGIVKDSSDPHLLANLRQLGQVRVDHHMQSIRTVCAKEVRQAFASRRQADEDASHTQTPRNRLWTFMLATVLEKRNQLRSRDELRALADEYNMDIDVLERVGRFINVPTVQETGTAMLGQGGNRPTTLVVSL
ncbi:hypothetical protein K488DRAFT_55431 [Vararia minispora EC-137]|uniref:Uncharacterized protein n=1 Tax=Vararia minispora EC-137 TaxID=1314806 RepID=A0ACB8QE24_9AGAM|nr:hypothetical protein K488DRAFT_55431 [Vararia minispora EC-137]